MKASDLHGGIGCGSIISSSLSLSRLIVFGNFASGNREYDPSFSFHSWARFAPHIVCFGQKELRLLMVRWENVPFDV